MRAKMAAGPFPLQGKLALAGAPVEEGRRKSGLGKLCAAPQDVWAPEIPAGFVRKGPSRLPV